jgi:hypothetical protein
VPLTRAALEWLKNKTKNEALKSALGEAATVADNVVASLKASVVDGLKAKSADGKLSAQEIGEISDAAKDMFLSDISARTLALLEENADDIGAYVGNLIESRLAQLKKG